MITSRSLMVVGLAAGALIFVNTVPTTLDLFGPQPAFSQGRGGGADNGGGGGSHGNNGGGHSASASQSGGHGNSANAPGHNKSSDGPTLVNTHAPAATPAGVPAAQGLDARVARLHAVNANLQALLHANAKSPVGMLREYAIAEVNVEQAQAARDLAEDELMDATTVRDDASGAYDTSLAALAGVYGDYDGISPEDLQIQYEDLMHVDTTGYTQEQLDALNAEIAAVEQVLPDAEALIEAQTAYDDADQALMDAEQALADAEMVAGDALNAAANANRVPVDDDVKEYVDTKLEEGGILDYFRAMGEEEDGDVIVE